MNLMNEIRQRQPKRTHILSIRKMENRQRNDENNTLHHHHQQQSQQQQEHKQ